MPAAWRDGLVGSASVAEGMEAMSRLENRLATLVRGLSALRWEREGSSSLGPALSGSSWVGALSDRFRFGVMSYTVLQTRINEVDEGELCRGARSSVTCGQVHEMRLRWTLISSVQPQPPHFLLRTTANRLSYSLILRHNRQL